MQREGTCGHCFMHSIGIYMTGCTYGNACVNKHERPGIEPPENSQDAAVVRTPVATMATAAVPNTNGAKPVLQEMQEDAANDTKSTILPNETNGWINSNKVTTRCGCSLTTMPTSCVVPATRSTHTSSRAKTGATTHCYCTRWHAHWPCRLWSVTNLLGGWQTKRM